MAARRETGIIKTVLAKSVEATEIPVAAAGQRGRRHEEVEFLQPAEGLHPKHVVFPGTPAGTWPTHYSYHEPEGCTLPQQVLPSDGKVPGKVPGNTLTPDGARATGLKGVFLLLHACQYSSDDWFALPEEVYMVHDLLSRGFLVVAPDAIIQPGGCWYPDLDREPLVHSFGLFRRAFGLEHLPLLAVGASMGGVMLDNLVAHGMAFAGTMFIVSPGTARHLYAGAFASKNHPPSAFVFMPQDIFGVKADIMGAVSALKQNGVPAVAFEVKPKPVHALIARAEVMRIDKSVMRQMVDDISNFNFCNKKRPDAAGSFYLKTDRTTNSEGAYLSLVSHFSLTKVQQKALWEELKVIEGLHSPTAEYFSESIDFLLTGRYATKAALLRRTSRKSAAANSSLGLVT